ncbi:MAG: hypothetical protein WCV81_02800 [Microgenomates group bacterium]|jgi:hypothetical protein
MNDPRIKFNKYFKVNKKDLDKEGFFNISLVSDLPLFIDPFHLFYSPKAEYQKLHKDIIEYLIFLRGISTNYAGMQLPASILNTYYKFPEVKQNWFGFSFIGNEGHGLGAKFAKALNNNFSELFNDFGSGKKTHHLEKLTLIADRVGKDSVSDFATNLIHGFLAKQTEEFTKTYVDKNQTKPFTIKRAEFDYVHQVWKPKVYVLPAYGGDYVLLTPKDLLTKNDTWINKTDFIEDFAEIPNSMPNDVLREQLSRYFDQKLKENAKTRLNKKTKKLEDYQTQETRGKAAIETAKKFPQSIDVYIKLKEEKGDQAKVISEEYVLETETFFENQFSNFAEQVDTKKTKPTSYKEALARALYFKECVELHDNYKNLYDGQKPADEDWIQRMFWLVWYGSESDLNREPKNGLGEPDFTASQGRKDKTVIEFKLASSSSLEKNILNQLEKYKEVNKTNQGIWVIIFFTYKDHQKVLGILKKNNLEGNKNYILVDARKDNKIPPSKIK